MAIAPPSHRGATRGYRVAAPIGGHWIVTGPTFDSRDEASAHMERVRLRFKRVVAITIPGRRHVGVSGPDLDRNRLTFVRFLVDTGRLHELAADVAHETVG
jgi:hypothetical protein